MYGVLQRMLELLSATGGGPIWITAPVHAVHQRLKQVDEQLPSDARVRKE